MNGFNDSAIGYDKDEVNRFVDYVIKKTETNILTIKNQQDEIKKLKDEIAVLKHKLNQYNVEFDNNENTKKILDREANLIIQEAKDNASRIVNDALLRAREVELQKEHLNKTIHMCKKNLRMTLNRQLEMLDDIEML